MILSPTSPPTLNSLTSILTFHCRIIYCEAQTYFILASILMPAQNTFFPSLFRDRFCVWFICFYVPAILAFVCTSRVKKQQTFKLWKKVSLAHSYMAAKMDWRSFHFNLNGFFCLSVSLSHSLCTVYSFFSCYFIFASIYYHSINAIH